LGLLPSILRNLQQARDCHNQQKRTVAKDHTVTFEGTLFQIPKPSPYRSYANKRIDVHVLLDGAVEFFYQNEKIARFDSKTRTHWAYIERTASGKGSAMDLFRLYQLKPLNSHPDIFTLPLP